MSPVEYLARCHCGTLTARYQTALAPSVWPVRACQCSFCRSHAALSTSDPRGSLAFRCESPARVSCYVFGGRTTQFFICRDCGVYVGAQMTSANGTFGILNVLSLRPLLMLLPPAAAMDYGDETAEARRLRRESRWTRVLDDFLLAR